MQKANFNYEETSPNDFRSHKRLGQDTRINVQGDVAVSESPVEDYLIKPTWYIYSLLGGQAKLPFVPHFSHTYVKAVMFSSQIFLDSINIFR